jgi:hypothetical protein
MQPGQSAQDYLRQAMEGPITEKKPAVEPPIEAPKAEPAAAAPETKGDEHPAAEGAKPGDAAPDATKEEPAAAAIVDAAFQNQEFLQSIEKAGFTREQLMQTARDAALTSEFVKEIGTPAAARFTKEAAGHFFDIEDAFPKIDSLQSFDDFMTNVMLPMSIVVGADGKPQQKPDGTFVTDGSVSKFFTFATAFNDRMEAKQIADLLKANPDSDDARDLQAAAKILTDWRKNNYKLGAPQTAEVSPEVQAREQRVTEREQNLRTEDNKRIETQKQEFSKRVEDDTFKQLEALVSETLKSVALSDKLKEKAADDIFIGLANRLDSNRTYKQMAAHLRARGLDENVAKELVALNFGEMKASYAEVVREVVSTYGAEAVRKNQQERQQTDTQIAADRQNPKVGATPGKPGVQRMTTIDIQKKAEENVLAANGGRRPADFNNQFLLEIMKLESAQAPAQVA